MVATTHQGISANGSQARVRRSQATFVLTRLLGVALAAALVLPLAEATQPAEAGKKFKTVTKTISSNGQIAIPAAGTSGIANPYPSTINVKAFKKYKKAKIKDVNLTLREITHTNPDDIDVMLALGNRKAIVMSDVGGAPNINGVTLTLDDQAGAELPDNALLTDGTFRPTNVGAGEMFPAPAPVANGNVALSTFKGAKPDGKWQLFVRDDSAVAGTTGSISGGWQLEITAKVKLDKKAKKQNAEDA
jgi:subtilisin-like proprotein convertase family protein